MANCPMCGQPEKKRSEQAHNLCFAAIGVAYKNWKETHSFQPKDEDHLRAWFCWEVGHTEHVDVDLTSIDAPPELAESIVISTMRAARSLLPNKHIVRMFRTENGVRVVAEKSMDYKTLGRHEFNALADKIYAKIKDEIGIDAPTLVKEDRKVA